MHNEYGASLWILKWVEAGIVEIFNPIGKLQRTTIMHTKKGAEEYAVRILVLPKNTRFNHVGDYIPDK